MPLNFDLEEPLKKKNKLNLDFGEVDFSNDLEKEHTRRKEEKAKAEQEQAEATRKAEEEAADPANWSLDQTKQYYKDNPPKNVEEAAKADFAIKAKKEQQASIIPDPEEKKEEKEEPKRSIPKPFFPGGLKGFEAVMKFSAGDISPIVKVAKEKLDKALPEYGKIAKQRWRKGYEVVRAGENWGEAMLNEKPVEQALQEDASIHEEYSKYPVEDVPFKRDALKNIWAAGVEMAPFMFEAMMAGTKGAAGGAVAGGLAGMAAGGPDPTDIALMGGGAKIGAAYRTIDYSMRVEGGNIFGTLVKEGIDPDIARGVSIPAGLVIGAIESLQIDQILTRPLRRVALKKLIDNPTVMGGIKKALTTYTKTYLSELAEEDLQKIVENTGTLIGRVIDGKIPAKDLTVEGVVKMMLKDLKQETIQAGKGMLLLPIGSAAVAGMSEINEAIKAEEAAQETTKKIEELTTEEEAPAVEKPEAKKEPTKPIPKVEPKAPAEKAPAPKAEKKITKPIVDKILEDISERKIAVEEAKVQLETLEPYRDLLTRRIKDKEFEGKAVPRRYRTNNVEGLSLDEALDEINTELGTDLQNESELVDYLANIEESVISLKDIIEKNKPKMERKTDITRLSAKVKDIQRGIKEGKKQGALESKEVTKALRELLDASGLPADAAWKHFSAKLQNITTWEQFSRQLTAIGKTLNRVTEQGNKQRAKTRIKKLLKTTKLKKAGATRIGKYDYETNKLFVELRNFQKLTQDQAQEKLDSIGEPETEAEAIQQRFLSLKANGQQASLILHEKVLADIRQAKMLGEAAKDDASFERSLERQEKIDEVLTGVGKMKGTEKNVRTKIVNVYRKGFSNIYSMLNSLAGKGLAEKYNPELHEKARDTAMFYQTQETVKVSADIFETKPNKMFNEFSRMGNEKFDLVDFEGLHTEVSKMDLLDIYNSLKNEAIKKRYYDAFGEDQITDLMTNITSPEKEFADYMQEVAQGYYDVLNERNIELKGIDLGTVENYWPATSEKPIDVYDDVKIQGETPAAMKERAKGKVIPVPKNAWLKLQKHIAQGEHIRHLSREYANLKKLFSNRKVKNHIEGTFGKDIYSTLMAQVENISLNKQTERLDAITSMLGKALSNWVTAKIALSPSVFVKQLISVGNYMENMAPGEWTKYFAQGILHPKKTFDYMWANSPYLKARYHRGYSEAIARAIEEARHVGGFKHTWTRALTSLVRMGDIGAIIYGGYPLMKKKGVKAFESATIQAQQSGLSSSRSQFQNSKNPLVRLFLAFKNTANQYFRKQVDAIISRANGDISSKQLAKTLTIYGIIQPTLYGYAGYLMGGLLYRGFDDEDEGFRAILEAIALNIFNAIPVIDDLAQTAIRKMQGKSIWKIFSTPLLDDLESGARLLLKKDITIYDVLESIGTFAEPIIAAPIKTYTRMIKKFSGTKGKSTKPFRLKGGKKKTRLKF